MFDMRAYIVSLIAVFLALAIGILLGTVVVDKGVLVEQQKALVENIQAQIKDLRSQNKNLRAKVNQLEEYANRVFIDLASNQLIDKQLLVLISPHTSIDLKRGLIDALILTGAKISIINTNSDSLNLDDQRVSQQISAYFAEGDLVNSASKKRIAEELAGVILGEKDSSFLSLLNNLNVVTLESPLERIPDAIIIMGEEKRAGNKFLTDFLLPLIGELISLNANVIVTEPDNSETSYISKYKDAGVKNTVDNINTVYGKTTLIYILKGASGHFGVKKTAEKFLPTP